MSDDASRAYCEGVFSETLGGHRLLSNRSRWINFRVISNRRWWREPGFAAAYEGYRAGRRPAGDPGG